MPSSIGSYHQTQAVGLTREKPGSAQGASADFSAQAKARLERERAAPAPASATTAASAPATLASQAAPAQPADSARLEKLRGFARELRARSELTASAQEPGAAALAQLLASASQGLSSAGPSNATALLAASERRPGAERPPGADSMSGFSPLGVGRIAPVAGAAALVAPAPAAPVRAPLPAALLPGAPERAQAPLAPGGQDFFPGRGARSYQWAQSVSEQEPPARPGTGFKGEA